MKIARRAAIIGGLASVFLAAEANARTTQIGSASIYSDRYNGRKTASGRIFRQNEFTAAHTDAPFGTKILVTNLSNNLSTIVVVTDRWAHPKNRIIDLSKAAAHKIGLTIVEGHTKVSLRFL